MLRMRVSREVTRGRPSKLSTRAGMQECQHEHLCMYACPIFDHRAHGDRPLDEAENGVRGTKDLEFWCIYAGIYAGIYAVM